MSGLFMFGAECRSIDTIFDTVGTAPTTSTARKRSDGASISLPAVDSAIRYDLGGNKTEIYVRFGLYITAAGGAAYVPIFYESLASSGAAQISLGVDGGRLILCRQGANGTKIAGSLVGIFRNVWNCIEIYHKVDDAAGVFTVKLNDAQVLHFTGDTQAQAAAEIRYLVIGRDWSWSSYGVAGYVDDIYVDDGGWPGHNGIYEIHPSAVGDKTEWDRYPATGEDSYEDVDERPPDDDTSYVQTAVLNEIDTYGATNLPHVGTIQALQWECRAKYTDEACDLAPDLFINAAHHVGANKTLTAAYKYYFQLYEDNPDDAAAWEKADVDGMEIGVKAT